MYHDSSSHSLSNLRSEIGSSGVTLVDCPSNGRKDAPAKKMIGSYLEHTFFPLENLKVFFTFSGRYGIYMGPSGSSNNCYH